MERMVGYERAILIDAFTTGNTPTGTITVFPLADLPDSAFGHLSSAHDTSLQKAIQVGHSMGVKLPDEIIILAIETNNTFDFSEELSPPVTACLPAATQILLEMIR